MGWCLACSSSVLSNITLAWYMKRVRDIPALVCVALEGRPAPCADEARDRQQLTDTAEVGSEESKRTTQRQK